MTAPQIPNLLDGLRASRPARGNVHGSFKSPRARHDPSRPSTDSVIQQTDDDAAGSRLSAVEVGYLEDDFAKAFASPQMQMGLRRMPVMNRGGSRCR